MKIEEKDRKQLLGVMAALKAARYPFWQLWREVADFFLPKRYVWLQSPNETKQITNARNPHILDSTGTLALRTLASGMMNGITSPSRPWVHVRVGGFEHEDDEVARWEDEVSRRLLYVMAESNFYNSMALLYLDLAAFGSAASLIYEDDENVIHCFNPALGEYYFGQDDKLRVDTFAREFTQTAKQLVAWFGEENVSERIRADWKEGGGRALNSYKVTHLIEPNFDGKSSISSNFRYRECYWTDCGLNEITLLTERGFHELPGIFPRWEVLSNESYGTSPAMDALADTIQLQVLTKRKAQGIDKMVNPPIVADIQLQHRPTALLPNGITYVAGANSIGAKPLYQITPPVNELMQDIREVQGRIRETLHNDLFRMISQIDTVRSATEIDARKEEKLVLLGSVLDRFEKEALSPAIERIYAIMERRGLIPEPPASLEDGTKIRLEYVSILSTAQRAVAAAPLERWLQLIGNVAPLAPQVAQVPDWEELVRDYGTDIGVKAKSMKSREALAEVQKAEAQKMLDDQAAQRTTELVDAGQQLSQTDVGGGANALQQLLASSS